MTNSRFQSLDSYYIGDSGGYFQIDIPSVRKRKYLHMYVRPYGRKPPVLSRQFARAAVRGALSPASYSIESRSYWGVMENKGRGTKN